MLQNAYFLAKIGADTAENEQHFAEILPIGRHVRSPRRGPRAALVGPAEREVEGAGARWTERQKPLGLRLNYLQEEGCGHKSTW